MPKWGEIFGGALQGAGGLMSQLALRHMEQADALERQRENQAALAAREDAARLAAQQEKLATGVLTGSYTIPQAEQFAAINPGLVLPTPLSPQEAANLEFQDISKTTDLAGVSTVGESLRNISQRSNLPFDVNALGQPFESFSNLYNRQDDGSLVDVGPSERGSIAGQLGSALSARREAISGAEPLVSITGVEDGMPGTRRIPGRELGFTPEDTEASLRRDVEQAGRVSRATSRESALGQFEAALSEVGVAAEDAASQRLMVRALAQNRANFQFNIDQSGMSPQQQTAALNLADDFYRESGDFFAIDASFRRLSSLVANPSAVSDVGLVFSLMKMFDPESTVREGEQDQARKTIPIFESIRQTYNRIVETGESLTTSQRLQFMNTARGVYESELGPHGTRLASFERRARAMQVPDRVIQQMYRGGEELPSIDEMRIPATWAAMVNEADISEVQGITNQATAAMSPSEQREFAAELQRLNFIVEEARPGARGRR